MFELDLRSYKSIYEQITDKFKELIMTGELECGAKILSVRDLSKTLGVNPNTIQKAYRELERQGYIYTATGVGTFVADKRDIKPDHEAVEKAKETIRGGFKELLYLGLSAEEAMKIAQEVIREKGEDK